MRNSRVLKEKVPFAIIFNMKELKITTLIENEPDDGAELAYEHGLSLFIEFDGKKILFDAGQTGAFLENAVKLGKQMEAVDFIFISHGHYDHSGGVPTLLDYLRDWNGEKSDSSRISMYVGAELFIPKYKKLPDDNWHYNGNPFTEAEVADAPVELHKLTEDVTYITKKIMVFKNFVRYTEYEKTNPKFYVKQDNIGNFYKPDEFVDEIVLGLLTSKGLVLVVGCSHVGIVNIMENVTRRTGLPIYSVLGGTHLVEADEQRLQKTVAAMRNYNLQEIAVSHCTGEQGMALVQEEFGLGFVRNNTGNIYRL